MPANDPAEDPTADPQAEVFRFLADPRTHGLNEPVKRIDTAGAVVFLAGPEVYKVKRAVKFPFMDLSTLEKRRLACEAEIAVNRENAPGIYLDALPIVRNGEDARDRRRRAKSSNGSRTCAASTRARRSIASRTAAASRTRSSTGSRSRSGDRMRALRCATPRPPPMRSRPISNRTTPPSPNGPISFRRRKRGSSRKIRGSPSPSPGLSCSRAGRPDSPADAMAICTCATSSLIDGEPTLFDAVEFSDEVASGDVLYDLAFLLMDLEERSLRGAANRLINRYLAPEPPEALAGLAALPLFLSLRAAIRAKVEAAGADRLDGAARDEALELARRYFDSAAGFLRYVPPRLVAVGGLSGAGKSALAVALAPRLGRAPGALMLRSDVERKAMFGVDETSRLPDSAYAPEVTRDVYQRIDDKARRALRAGQAVVLDATFSTRAGAPSGRRRRSRSRRRLRRPFSRGPARDPASARQGSRGRRVGCGRFRRAQPASRAARRKGVDRARRRRGAERNDRAGARSVALRPVVDAH